MRLRSLILTAAVASGAAGAFAQESHVIHTIAGGGPDQLPKLEANVEIPRSLAVDLAGNVYVLAAGSSSRVYRISTDGIMTILAGNGPRGFSGDGGPAKDANISPNGIAVDGAGNVFMADAFNRVRRVDAATGIITTVAGNGDWGSHGDGGPATEASIIYPQAVDMDVAGNLFIAEAWGNRVRRVDAASGVITTVAGNGLWGFEGDAGPATSASLASPLDVAVGPDGSLLIADSGNFRVRRVDSSGVITTVAGDGSWGSFVDGGPATQTSLGDVSGIALDGSGGYFIIAGYPLRVRRIDAGGIITAFAGTGEWGFSGDGGPAVDAQLVGVGVATDSAGNLYIPDSYNYRVRRVEAATGIITTFAGNGQAYFSGDGYPGIKGSLAFLNGLAVTPGGDVAVTDLDQRIRRIDGASTVMSTAAGTGGWGSAGDGGPATEATLTNPEGIASDASGNLYFADRDNNRIRRIDAATGIITTIAGNGVQGFSGDGGLATSASLNAPSDVALDSAGNLYIADRSNNRVRRVDAGTQTITTVAGDGIRGFGGDGGPATAASFWGPSEIAIDALGRLYVVDEHNHRVRRVGTDGVITTIAGDGGTEFGADGVPATATGLSAPFDIAVTQADTLLLLSHWRLRLIDADGILRTLAGNGTQDFSGDGGPASSAGFSMAVAIDVDPAGTMYLADQGYQRVRRIDNAIPTASSGGPYSGVRNQAVAFDAIASTDADGDPLGYRWDFGDGATGTGVTPSHVYSTLGPHTVTLAVDDGLTLSPAVTTSVTIANQIPSADAGADQTLEWGGSSVTLTGSGSDPDSDALSYEWRDQGSAVVATTASFTVSLGLGTHDFTLTVRDGFEGSASDSVRVIVQDTTAPSVAVTAPSGVEITAGIATTIAWTASDAGTLMGFDVLFSTDGGANLSPVPGCSGLAGSIRACAWASPGPATAQGRIRVLGRDASNNTGAGESSFTIAAPAIIVTAPNTFVSWAVGSTRTITWNHNLGSATNVKIEVSRNGGGTWTTIAASVANTGSYAWLVTGPTTTTARIRVSWTSNLSINDSSDANFKIATGSITVIVPNSAVTWGIGTTQTISWSHNLGPSSSVKIEVSRNGGNNYSLVAASVPNNGASSGTYDWVVTGPATIRARIKVTWTSNAAVHDRSDVNFIIQ